MELAMQCNEAQELISEYIDKRLDPKTTERLNGHLSACSNCRVKTERLSQTNRLFASLPQVEPPVGFTTRLMAHVHEEATKPNFWKWLSLPFQIGVPIQATAVVLIAVLAGFLYQKERPLKTSTQEVPIGEKKTSEHDAQTQAPGMQEQQRQAEPLSQLSQEAQRQQQRSAPYSALRSFGSDSSVLDAGREHSRVGGEAAVDDRLVVRLRVPAPGEISMPSLSPNQVKNLDRGRQRAAQTGQTQSELFSIPRDRYEQFKKELAAIGNIESDRPRTPQKSESSATKSDPLLIMVTIVPPAPPVQRPTR
jgi:Putative zinc-finger